MLGFGDKSGTWDLGSHANALSVNGKAYKLRTNSQKYMCHDDSWNTCSKYKHPLEV